MVKQEDELTIEELLDLFPTVDNFWVVEEGKSDSTAIQYNRLGLYHSKRMESKVRKWWNEDNALCIEFY